MNITVKSIEEKPYRHLFSREDTRMTVVYVEVESYGITTTLGLSRHEDELDYYVDSRIESNGYPHFVHGEGSRVCSKMVAQGELADAIARAMLVRAIDEVIDENLS